MDLDDVRTFLLADADIAAAVKVGELGRIYPTILPQDATFPAITYTPVSGQSHHTTAGRSALTVRRVQIDCWSFDHEEARTVAGLVRARLDGYRGPAGSGTIQGAFMIAERYLFGDGVENAVPIHRISRDYEIWLND